MMNTYLCMFACMNLCVCVNVCAYMCVGERENYIGGGINRREN